MLRKAFCKFLRGDLVISSLKGMVFASQTLCGAWSMQLLGPEMNSQMMLGCSPRR